MVQYVHAGDFIIDHGLADVLDITLSDKEPLRRGVVGDNRAWKKVGGVTDEGISGDA